MDHELELERVASRRDVAAILGAVAGGVASGRLRVADPADPDDRFDLDIPETLGVGIELEAEADGVEIELELDWEPADGERPVTPAERDRGTVPADAADEPGAKAAEVESAESADAAPEADDADGASGGVEAKPALTGLFAPAPTVAHDDETDTVEEGGTGANVPESGDSEAATSRARFELFTDTAGEWRWRLRHHNGNVVATSGEGYTRKANARKGLASVVANAPGAVVVET
ncbi:hypothetical protein JCM17823_26000 [Halorubrum gandharaense]